MTHIPEGPWTKRGAIAGIIGVIVALTFGILSITHEKSSPQPTPHTATKPPIAEPVPPAVLSPQSGMATAPVTQRPLETHDTRAMKALTSSQSPTSPVGALLPGAPCKSDDSCKSDNCFRGVCAPRSQKNGPCDESYHCESGLRCVDGACVAKLGTGAPCKSDDSCKSDNCFRGVCAPRSQKNGPCDESYHCESGLRCVDGACVAKLGTGAPCKSDDSCESDNCFRGVCAPRSQKNGPCDESYHCESGLRCVDGACVERLGH